MRSMLVTETPPLPDLDLGEVGPRHLDGVGEGLPARTESFSQLLYPQSHLATMTPMIKGTGAAILRHKLVPTS